MLPKKLTLTFVFVIGALVLNGVLWLVQENILNPALGAPPAFWFEAVGRSVTTAAIAGVIVDGLRYIGQQIVPLKKKKPKFPLRDVMKTNLD